MDRTTNGERNGAAYSVLLLGALKKVLKFAVSVAFLSLKLEDIQRKCLNLPTDQKWLVPPLSKLITDSNRMNNMIRI